MNILLLSAGGGGGNILRSVKALFRSDLARAHRTDPSYAERLRRAVTFRFLDTNEFSLIDIPPDERVLIGAKTTRRLGSMHNPQLAKEALEESRKAVASLFEPYSVIVTIGTGGKGTGAGTLLPLATLAREQKKLVLPIFVRPSFEWHEVEKRRYDHALTIVEQFDASKIRLMEILNDRGYSDADPQPQAVVWERMNRPIARALRGLLYVFWDLSQVDPSDLSALFSGAGRLRIGFSEIEPASNQDPTDEQIDAAARECWHNAYCAFTKPIGTSLVCIHGDWSNVVDAKIKGRLATLALNGARDSGYNPLYARVSHTPKPWGITALFAEETGGTASIDIDWRVGRRRRSRRPIRMPVTIFPFAKDGPSVEAPSLTASASSAAHTEQPVQQPAPASAEVANQRPHFTGFWEFALAVNRSDAAALAVAGNGAECDIPIDATEVRKLLTTVWFRQVFARLSERWRARILDSLANGITITNHTLRHGRRTIYLSEATYGQLREAVTETVLPEAVRSDLQLLLAVGMLWGGDAIRGFQFTSAETVLPPARPGFWPLSSAPSWLDRFRLQSRAPETAASATDASTAAVLRRDSN